MRFPQFAKAMAVGIALVLGAGVEKSFAIPLPVLLTIDDSNPSAIVITTSGLAPAVNDSGTTAGSGVDLFNFFLANESSVFGLSLSGSSLIGGNSGVAYDSFLSDNFSAGGDSFVDLRLYVEGSSPGSGNTQAFSTSQSAFTGTWVLDLASLGVNSSALPSVGTRGEVFSGNSGNPGTLLGQWEIVSIPEPGIGSLFVLGSIISFAAKRRRRS